MSKLVTNTITPQSGDTVTVSNKLNVLGLLTYEDVTNVDSVGIITARAGVGIADSIFHTGDTNTAIRFPTADTFTVETGGSERLRIDSTGHFGLNVGTGNGYTAQLNDTAGSATLQLTNATIGSGSGDGSRITASTSGVLFIENQENNDIHFYTNGAERLRITNTNAEFAGGITAAGNLDFTDSTVDLYSQTTTSSSRTFQLFSDIGATKAEKLAVQANGNVTIGPYDTSPYVQGMKLFNDNGGRSTVVINADGTTNMAFGIYDGNSTAYVNKINHDGSALFAGDVTVKAAAGAYVKSYAAGYITIGNAANFGQAFGLYDETNNAYASTMSMNGNAMFKGSFDIGNNGGSSSNTGHWKQANGEYWQFIDNSTSYKAYQLFNTTVEVASISKDGVISDSIGPLRRLGQEIKSGDYTLVAGDAGKHIRVDGNHTITVPDNVFTAGDMITIVANSASTVAITQGSGLNLYNATDGTTGNKTQAARTVSTILFAEGGSGSKAYISGGGLS